MKDPMQPVIDNIDAAFAKLPSRTVQSTAVKIRKALETIKNELGLDLRQSLSGGSFLVQTNGASHALYPDQLQEVISALELLREVADEEPEPAGLDLREESFRGAHARR